MTHYVNNEPIPNTCPDIDKIIDTIRSIIIKLRFIFQHSERSYTEDFIWIIKKLDKIAGDMEKIKKDNRTLRRWGNEELGRAKEAEEQESGGEYGTIH
ncbi:MAG: hypothetical protein ABFD61_08090 [Chloroherpetonaceae bacterium]